MVRDFFKLLGTFLGRYRLGERVHDSATATAVRAVDVYNNAQVSPLKCACACTAIPVCKSAPAGLAAAFPSCHQQQSAPSVTQVVIKFMFDRGQYEREIKAREKFQGQDSADFILTIVTTSEDLDREPGDAQANLQPCLP